MASWGKAKFLSIIILLAVSIGACSEKEGLPEGTLSKEEFTHLLIEIHLIEAKLGRMYLSSDSTQALYDYFEGLLLYEEGVDSAKFYNTLAYYNENPKPFKKVYEAVTDSLIELEAKGKLIQSEKKQDQKTEKKTSPNKASKDSTNVDAEAKDLSLKGDRKIQRLKKTE